MTRSVEFDPVEITLLRLADGHEPDPEEWVTDRPSNRMLFDNMLLARAPNAVHEMPTDAEAQLQRWAELLRSVAPDFLAGSDAAVVEAEQVVRERVAEYPQELTIWLPRDATDADERKAQEDAERTAPDNVHITVRRYER